MIKTVRNAAALILLFFAVGFTTPTHQRGDTPVAAAPNHSLIKNRAITNPAATISSLYITCKLATAGLSQEAFTMAMKGLAHYSQKVAANSQIITIIDFSRPSTQKRLFVIDISRGKLLLQSLVAHGKNSGEKYAKYFSNKEASCKSSLGMYVTMGSYTGKHGYSLKLKGCEAGINDNAYNRDIVLHGADYVSNGFISARGFLGRSEGCPAVPENMSKKIIDYIKGGSCFFIYHPSPEYKKNSKLLNW